MCVKDFVCCLLLSTPSVTSRCAVDNENWDDMKTTAGLCWSRLTALAPQNLSSLTQSMFTSHSSHSSVWVGKETLASPSHSGEM